MHTSKRPALLLATLTVATLAWPFAMHAASCSLSALDTVAGLGTEISLTNCSPGSSMDVEVTGAHGAIDRESVTTDASGNATLIVPSKFTVTAGTYTVSAAGKTASFTVMADRMDEANSTFTSSRTTLTSDGRQTATITAVLRDKYDNPIVGRAVTLMSARTSDDIVPESSETDDDGRFLWTVRATEAGTMVLMPFDIVTNRAMKLRLQIPVVRQGSAIKASLTAGAIGGDLQADTVENSAIDRFDLSLPQGATRVKANELFSITIRAMRGSEVVRSYVGTLTVTSTDPDAELPKKGEDPQFPTEGRVDMRSVDQGQRNVPLAFVLRQGGMQRLTVADRTNPAITGELTLEVTQGDGTGVNQIVIVDPKDRSRVRGTEIRLQGKAPSLVNLKVKGGAAPVDAESDAEGVFRVTVPVNPQDREVTLFVESENGTYESEPVHVIMDNEPPAIETATFNPPEGQTGAPAALTVKTSEDVTSVVATLDGRETTLTTESGGTFSGAITAPATEGIYDATVKAKDGAGNETTLLLKWTVKPTLLPVVQGVTVESQPLQVTVHWQPVTSMPITSYKIYVALKEDPTNIVFSLPTGTAVTSAVIKDLTLGTSYAFSVTALTSDGRESPEKSIPAIGTPLGMHVTVTPGDGSLLLQWNAMDHLPLSQYNLEYGTEPGVYIERRTVSGDATTTVLRDLLNDVTYELRLTPVSVTGNVETDLAAVVRGTPTGSGYTVGMNERVPSDVFGTMHAGAPLDTASPPVNNLGDLPQTTSSGLPTTVAAALLTIVAIGIVLYRRRLKSERLLTERFLQMMEEKYHTS